MRSFGCPLLVDLHSLADTDCLETGILQGCKACEQARGFD